MANRNPTTMLARSAGELALYVRDHDVPFCHALLVLAAPPLPANLAGARPLPNLLVSSQSY